MTHLLILQATPEGFSSNPFDKKLNQPIALFFFSSKKNHSSFFFSFKKLTVALNHLNDKDEFIL